MQELTLKFAEVIVLAFAVDVHLSSVFDNLTLLKKCKLRKTPVLL